MLVLPTSKTIHETLSEMSTSSTAAWLLLFTVILGVCVWCWREMRALRRMPDRTATTAEKYVLPVRSVLYAPLANIPITALLGYSPYSDIFSIIGHGLVAAAIFTFLFYLAVALFGVPLYFLLLRFNMLNIWTISLFGAGIPLAWLARDPDLNQALLLVTASLAVSITAFILRPRPPI